MIVILSEEQGFELLLPAQFAEIELVCLEVEGFLARQGLSRLAFAILLGVREALTNAIRHGSGLDPAQEIRFGMSLEGERLCLQISDQGPGFNWRGRETLPPPHLAEGGRGLAIIQRYFDTVQFNERGNELRLEIKVKDGNGGIAGVEA